MINTTLSLGLCVVKKFTESSIRPFVFEAQTEDRHHLFSSEKQTVTQIGDGEYFNVKGQALPN